MTTTTIETIETVSTKKVIEAAYKKAEKALTDLKEQQLDPAAIALEKQNKAVLDLAVQATNSSLEEVVSSLQAIVDSSLNELVAVFTTKQNEFENLENAIVIKKQQLEDILGIELEVASLAALINSHEVIKKQQAEENANTLNKFQSELTSIQKQIQDAVELYATTLEQQENKLKQEETRRREDFEYTFAREKKAKQDELADEMAQAQKEIDERYTELSKQEIALETREEKMEELEVTVADIPRLLEEARKEAKEEGRKAAETSAAFEKRAYEAKKDAEIGILKNQVEHLTKGWDDEKAEHKDTKAKLELAYERIQNVATASVDGAKANDALKALSNQDKK